MPMPSTVPATAKGEVATTSINADRRERFIGLDREDRLVFGQHEGNAEIFQRLDENQQRAGENRRHDQRQRHGAQHARPRRAEILRGFLDRLIDRLERGGDRQHDIGIERERIDGDDAPCTVDGIKGNADRMQQAGHETGPSEQQHQRIGADEGGKHQR
jgi:hypothetical protein